MTTPSDNSIRGITGSTVNGVLLGPDVVLKKSAKGRDEITSRAHKLPLNLRRILILVDGDQTIASITELTIGLTKVEESLSLLIDLGFLEVSGLRVDETQTLQIIGGPAAPLNSFGQPNHTGQPESAKPEPKPALVPMMQVTASSASAGAATAKKLAPPPVAANQGPPSQAASSDLGPVLGPQEKLIIARSEENGPTLEQIFAAKSSELIRIANEHAIKNAIAHAVAVDNSLTIPPSAHYKKLTASGLAPVVENRMAPEKLNAAKAALIVEARRLLGPDAERLIPKIQSVENVNDVMDWVLKFREYFLITGKDEADGFVSRFQEMLR